MQDSVSPKKAKKKKSSFLDDDDFFVVKKSKKAKTKVASQVPEAAPQISHTSQQPVKQDIDSPGHEAHEPIPIPASRTPSSDNRDIAFFSAAESFSDPAPIAPIDLDTENPPLGVEIESVNLSESETKLETDFDKGAEEEEEEEEDSDLRSFFKNVSKSQEDAGDESSRLYNVKITSKLGFQQLVYNKQITGNTTFNELIQILQDDTLREYGVADYWGHGVLVWVEGKSELKPIFKPSTLRIPIKNGEISTISCLYIPREHLPTFERLYEEFRNDKTNGDIPTEDDQPTIYSLSDSEEEEIPEAPKNEYFVIGLKGKDNKRVEAEVGPTTKIGSLLKYYLQVKGIKDAKIEQCKLLFDDEELSLDTVVADTELEEDFEIQVYIN